MFISIIAVDEPADVITICEGGGTVYSCELNTTNTNISSDDVQWYRFIKDIGTTEMINADGTGINFATNHSRNILTTTLYITDTRKFYTGYYRINLLSDDVCNVSLTVEICMWIEFYTIYVTS